MKMCEVCLDLLMPVISRAGKLFSAQNPVGCPVNQAAHKDGIKGCRHIGADPKKYCAHSPKEPGGDGESAEGIKYGLPGIAGRVAYADAAQKADHGMKLLWQKGVDNKKDQRTQDIADPACFGSFCQILLKRQAHGHTGDPYPHGPGDIQKGRDQQSRRYAQSQLDIPPVPYGTGIKFMKKILKFPLMGPVFLIFKKYSHA